MRYDADAGVVHDRLTESRDRDEEGGMQGELFQAQTTWFHVFVNMIESGDVAKMGPYAITTYLVIKAHTNFSTGSAFPSLDTIVQKSGISLAQVKRALKILEDSGYIERTRTGRANLYKLKEKVEIHDKEGRPAAVATWDYLPTAVGEATAQIRNYVAKGQIADGPVTIVRIENLNLQININSGGGTMNVAQAPDTFHKR